MSSQRACSRSTTSYPTRHTRSGRRAPAGCGCGQRCRHDCSPTKGTIWRGLPLARFRLANPWKHQRGTWPSITPLRNNGAACLAAEPEYRTHSKAGVPSGPRPHLVARSGHVGHQLADDVGGGTEVGECSLPVSRTPGGCKHIEDESRGGPRLPVAGRSAHLAGVADVGVIRQHPEDRGECFTIRVLSDRTSAKATEESSARLLVARLLCHDRNRETTRSAWDSLVAVGIAGCASVGTIASRESDRDLRQASPHRWAASGRASAWRSCPVAATRS
jgi:hypothetical protein